MESITEELSVSEIVKSSRLLDCLSEETLAQMIESSESLVFKRGETVWYTGQEVDYVCIVGSGFVKMVRSFSSGQEVTAEIHGPGQLFGMLGTIQGCGCPLEARAVTRVQLAAVPKEKALDAYMTSIQLKDKLIQISAERMHQKVDLVAQMATASVEERIAMILYSLVEHFGKEDSNGVIDILVPLARQDIAEMAGTTVESTIRVMSRWQKEGIVAGRIKRICICNPEALWQHLKS